MEPSMEVFKVAQFVLLRSVEQRYMYLHAAEDGRSVRLDARRVSHNAVWAVQRRYSGDGEGAGVTPYVLLRGAYGRYLGAHACACSPLSCSCSWCPPLSCSCSCACSCSCCPSTPSRAAAQRDFDEPEMKDIMWRAVETGSPDGILLHDASGRFLCANPRCLPCHAGVSVSTCGCLGTTMQWSVENVPRVVLRGRPEIPIARESEWAMLFACVCPSLSRLWEWWFTSEREIRWVRASDASGDFSEDEWASFKYAGRHAMPLRTKLLHLLGNARLVFRLTLCIRAGRYGQPSPLAINLPRSREPLDIVVFMVGTAAGDQLIFPDLDALTLNNNQALHIELTTSQIAP